MQSDKTIILPVLLIVVIFVALGFIQVLFQSDMQKTLKQSENNFREMTQTQRIMNHTLDMISHSQPQSNFTAQAKAVTDIEYLKEAVDDIKRMLNESRELG